MSYPLSPDSRRIIPNQDERELQNDVADAWLNTLITQRRRLVVLLAQSPSLRGSWRKPFTTAAPERYAKPLAKSTWARIVSLRNAPSAPRKCFRKTTCRA